MALLTVDEHIAAREGSAQEEHGDLKNSPLSWRTKLEALCVELQISGVNALSDDGARAVLRALQIIEGFYSDNGKILKGIDLKSQVWVQDRKDIIAAVEHNAYFAEIAGRAEGSLDLARLNAASLKKIVQHITEYVEGGWLSRSKAHLPGSSYAESIAVLSGITAVPSDPKAQLETARDLLRLQQMYRKALQNADTLKKLMPNENFAENLSNAPFWYKIGQLANSLCDFFGTTEKLQARNTLLNLLLQPQKVYEAGSVLRELYPSPQS